jgi:SAM-dependent methyltransferase
MGNKKADILAEVANYYSSKLAEHGETPRGVDWNGEESQILRFAQLNKVICMPSGFSLIDLGCGYGALFDYLNACYQDFFYLGYDVSPGMIQSAQKRFSKQTNVRFEIGDNPSEIADYSVASGIFNVKLDRSDVEWREHLEDTLDILDQTSRKGFSFNCLTSYSETEKMRDYLYYANPCEMFDLCKRRYSKNVALVHDYGLYEFTIHVRKVQ